MKKLAIILALVLSACQTVGSDPNLETRKAVLKKVAEAEKAKGNNQVAAQLEAQIMALDKGDAPSYLALIDELENIGDTKLVLETAEAGVKQHPDNVELKLALSKAYIDNNKPQQALDLLGSMEDFKTVEYYNYSGIAHDMLGQYASAQESYDSALALSANNLMAMNNKSISYLLSNEPEKAIPVLEKLSKRSDATYRIRSNLALAYGLSKQDKKAKEILARDLSKRQIEENMKYYRELRRKN